MKTYLVVLALLASSSAYCNESFDVAISAANQAFLEKDGTKLLVKIKEVLEKSKNHPTLVADQMKQLAAAQKQGMLKNAKVNWNLPSEVEDLKIEIGRRANKANEKVVSFLDVSGSFKPKSSLEQLQVIRYPDKVILDKAGKVGEYGSEAKDGDMLFWLTSARTSERVEEGLYMINIQVKDRPMVQGWFLLSEVNASTSPEVLAPKLNQVYNKRMPIFSWRRFQSPEYKTGEKVRLKVLVDKESDTSMTTAMEVQLDPGKTSFSVGNKKGAKEYEGETRLAPGRYEFNLGYQERSTFGDLIISRKSVTRVPFSVK